MSKDPKHVFEVAATVGLGSRGFTPKAMAVILQGVKESIEEAKGGVDGLDPDLHLQVAANTSNISHNADSISKNIDSCYRNSSAIAANADDIKELKDAPAHVCEVSKQDLSTATAALPYRLETDKITREGKKESKGARGGEIQLVDNLGAFHNVVFKGLSGVATSSDEQGIIVDGSELLSQIKDLQREVDILKNILNAESKLKTKKNASVTKGKGTN